MLLLGLMGITLMLPAHGSEKEQKQATHLDALFSWDFHEGSKSYREGSLAVLRDMKATRIFQSYEGTTLFREENITFIRALQQQDKQVYRLIGMPDWSFNKGQQPMKKQIEEVVFFNKYVINDGIKGIVIDVEPYLTAAWTRNDKATMKTYVSNMLKIYQYAHERGIYVVMCIPNWYDYLAGDLEKLIAYGCDEVAIMNYNRGEELEKIGLERELAEQYDKKIMSIFETIKPGIHQLKESNTYYSVGIDELKRAAETLVKDVGSNNFSVGYHYYDAIKEMK